MERQWQRYARISGPLRYADNFHMRIAGAESNTAIGTAKLGIETESNRKKCNGSVPDVVSSTDYPGDGSTAWGEAATIIPWNVYLHYGDKKYWCVSMTA